MAELDPVVATPLNRLQAAYRPENWRSADVLKRG